MTHDSVCSAVLSRNKGKGECLQVVGCVHRSRELGAQTLEEMDAAFGDNATDKEREHMERICRELGLPAQALLSA